MLTQNPFLQLTLPRVTKAISRVEHLIWFPAGSIQVSFAGAFPEPVPFEKARRRNFRQVALPFHWGKAFDQGWFRVGLPEQKSREPLYLHWNDQGEGTVYVDGVPYYGFDVAHRYCPLPRGAREVFIESLCLQSAIWHPSATGLNNPLGSQLSAASLMRRDPLAWARTRSRCKARSGPSSCIRISLTNSRHGISICKP
jgi:alpha-mannosidase